MVTLILLGAEGAAEIDSVPWAREATPDEVHDFKADHNLSDHAFIDLLQDGTGRPYFLTALLHETPSEFLDQARRHVRVVRLGR